MGVLGRKARGAIRIAWAVAALTLGFLGQAGLAHAQFQLPDPPPITSEPDERGVDVVDLGVKIGGVELTIGDPSAGGLVFSRTWFQGSDLGPDRRANSGWTHNYNGYVAWNSGRTSYWVVLGGSTVEFSRAASLGAFTALKKTGTTMTGTGGSASSEILTFTAADGTVAVFDPAYSTSPSSVTSARVKTITKPDGEKSTFTYALVSSNYSGPLQSVTNNLGYQLKLEYSSGTLSKVTGINMAVEYCDPAATSCTLSGSWPTVTYASSTSSGVISETVTDSVSQVKTYRFTNITYGGSNQHRVMTAIRLPGSSSDDLTYSYSGHRVSSVTDGGQTWSYSYSTLFPNCSFSGCTTVTITDPLSRTRVVTVWSHALVVRDTIPNVSEVYRTYRSTTDWLPQDIYEAGVSKTFTYDARGNVTQIAIDTSSTSPITTSANFSSSCSNPLVCNKPTYTIDERGQQTDYEYSTAHGGVTKITHPAPYSGAARPEERFTYTQLFAYYKTGSSTAAASSDGVYRLTKVETCASGAGNVCNSASNEVETTLAYGPTSSANNLQLVSVTTGSGDGTSTAPATTTAAYDDVGNLVSFDGPLSNDTSEFTYDAVRRQTGIVGPDPDGSDPLKRRAVKTTYNSSTGLVDQVDVGTLNSQSSNWATFASLGQMATTYNSRRLPEKQTASASSTTYGVTQTSYNNAGQVDCVAVRMNPAAFSSPPGACSLGTAGSNGNDRITKYGYDSYGRNNKVTTGYGDSLQQDTVTKTFLYGDIVETLVNAGGNTTSYEYDPFLRLKKVIYPNSSSEQFTYDAASNIASVRQRDNNTIYPTYDYLNRVTSDLAGVAYTYDNLGRILTQAKSGHTITKTWDARGMMSSQTGPIGTVSYGYDLAGQRTSMTWPDSFKIEYLWDHAGDLTTIREDGVTTGVGVLATFAYDDLGRRTGITRGNGVTTAYTFDAMSRLSDLVQDLASTGYDQTLSFTRNASGQILSRSSSNSAYDQAIPSSVSRSYGTANNMNQLPQAGSASLSYSTNGNLSGDGTNTYAYDVANRLTGMSSTVSLAYDPLSRLYEIAGSSTTRFAYDGVDMIGEYNTSNTIQRRYVHGPGLDEPLVWYEGSGTSDRRWLIADERGSIIAVTNSSGVASSAITYDAFGQSSSATRFGYTGQMWMPEVGLYHYKARAYSPSLGRFLQPDPIGYEGGMNLYAYVGNDPVNGTDPSGLITMVCGTYEIHGVETQSDIEHYLRNGCEEQTTTVSEIVSCATGTSAVTGNCRTLSEVQYCEDNPNHYVCTGRFGQLYDPRRPYLSDEQLRVDYYADRAADQNQWIVWVGLAPVAAVAAAEGGAAVAARGCNCFEAGTLIDTAEGLRPIEEIRSGDRVLARDEITGATAYKPVVALIAGSVRQIWAVEVEYRASNGQTVREVIGVTDDHPWRTVGGEWSTTAELYPGLKLVRSDGEPATVISITDTGRSERTYNFEVADFHTYFVGKGGMWVHNQQCTPGQLAAFARQLAVAGRESLLRSQASIQARLAEHEAKLARYLSEGGYMSSVMKEVRNFRGELEAIRRVLGQ